MPCRGWSALVLIPEKTDEIKGGKKKSNMVKLDTFIYKLFERHPIKSWSELVIQTKL